MEMLHFTSQVHNVRRLAVSGLGRILGSRSSYTTGPATDVIGYTGHPGFLHVEPTTSDETHGFDFEDLPDLAVAFRGDRVELYLSRGTLHG